MGPAAGAYPDVAVDAAAFDAHVAACRARGGARPEHLADLYLAFAAGRGDPAALRHLDALVAPDLEAAARRLDRAPAFVDEVRQALRVRLLVVDSRDGRDGRARIADYAGRGPLRGWVAVAALRVALNLRRAATPHSADVLADLVSHEADPELAHLKQLYRAEFRDALAAALAALPERQRAVLRLHFVDGLKLAQLARLYRVHESTVSRWVTQAAAGVADDARRRLTARLALSPASLDSVARMVVSNLDLSIARLLGG